MNDSEEDYGDETSFEPSESPIDAELSAGASLDENSLENPFLTDKYYLSGIEQISRNYSIE